MISHQTVNKKAQYDTGLLNSILERIEEGRILSHVGVAVYYYGYKALTDRNNVEHFEHLSRILHEKGEAFPAAELKELFLLAINYCISRINVGQEAFFQRAFQLYKEGFGHSILVEENGTVSRILFTNSVIIIFINKALPYFGLNVPFETLF